MGNSFVIPVPPSVNNIYHNVGKSRRMTGRAKIYKEQVGWIAKTWAAENNWAYDGGDVSMSLDLIFSNKIKRDITNCIKIAEDAVSETLGFDDRKCVEFIVKLVGYDKKNPRAIFTLVNGNHIRSCKHCIHFAMHDGEEFSDDDIRYGKCTLGGSNHMIIDSDVTSTFGCNNFDKFSKPFEMEGI